MGVYDLDGCIVTFEQTQAELEDIERQLAHRHGIEGDTLAIRKALIEMIRSGAIIEDELVADWLGAHASYLDWLRNGESA
jgi:hypothetical protein